MGFVEEELAQMWAEILDATDVTLGSHWQALGGRPEAVRTLADRIDEELGTRVEPAGLLGAGTLEGMARLVRGAMAARKAAAAPAAGPAGPRAGARPERPALSFAQQRLWFMQEIDPGTTLYNVPTVLRLRGALDHDRLGRALTALVARHEVLRTTYRASSGVPHQVVAAPGEFALPYTDLTAEARPAAEAARVAADVGAYVFDLAADLPLRAHLLRLAADDHHLVVTFHHIAIDGWSVEIFFRELGELYGDPGAGVAPVLQYADYAVWQRERLQGESLDALTAHWRAVLGDDPQALAVPTDHPRPRHRSFRGAVATRALGPELTYRLREFGRSERGTLNMTLLAGFQALLAGWSGTDDVTVGIPVAGRTRPELQELLGCLINMVPVRVGLGGDPAFRGLLARTRTALLDASAQQELPFDKLVEALVSRRGRDFLPVFRVMFSFLKEQSDPVFAGLEHCSLDLTGPQDTAKYDLSLYAQESGAGVALTLEYDTDLFGPETPAALLAAYEQTLHDAITFPDGPVLDLPAVRFRQSGTERNTHRDR
ncbi:condensation domain-containing protein [Streptomyces virginiae]|uniref:condensation domain-containing protein n=1 Tax=Streptomyces virginiae TaxID=1961 RepID=UPI00225104DF|nr:condensation domain-containing protein [Streptomyces virginiae]MCX5177878.1 condensation domain-containing protein [Streptomyces virginiae]